MDVLSTQMKATKSKVAKTASPELTGRTPEPQPDTDTVYGMDVDEVGLLIPLTVAPPAPRCIQARLEGRDRVWRWLSFPGIHGMGTRGYELYSPDETERAAISSGRDAPPGVFVDVENRVRWREDGVLASMPAKLYRMRRKIVADQTAAQTKLAHDVQAYAAQIAQRSGGKARAVFETQQYQGREEDLPPLP